MVTVRERVVVLIKLVASNDTCKGKEDANRYHKFYVTRWFAQYYGLFSNKRSAVQTCPASE